jgi:hypothetical protein
MPKPPKPTSRQVKNLADAVTEYVSMKGGKVDYVDGIECNEWAPDDEGVFHIAIRCHGTPPEYAQNAKLVARALKR